MTTKRRGPGRPEKHPTHKRTELLRVMLTPGEKAALERSATAARLDISETVRTALAPLFTQATP